MKNKFKQKEFSDAVKETMFTKMANEKKRIGLRVFAKQIGISHSTLSRIENGNLPDVETFFRLCKWMKRSSEDFFKF